MISRQGAGGESGNVVVEFVGVMGVLMVPAIIAILVFSTLIGARMAVDAAARDAARAYVRAESSEQGRVRAQAMADLALRERGIDAPARLEVRCSANPCLSPSGTIEVRVVAAVSLPLVGGRADVGQTHTFAVDEFRQVRQ
ncbi:MAG: TadE/TadG family type IV pilus assembly protein [Actinomycetaceae bacterium]|nr:TadE/TadG family type IV pilus assembly protein [Actinomycetaceae bacterium]